MVGSRSSFAFGSPRGPSNEKAPEFGNLSYKVSEPGANDHLPKNCLENNLPNPETKVR